LRFIREGETAAGIGAYGTVILVPGLWAGKTGEIGVCSGFRRCGRKPEQTPIFPVFSRDRSGDERRRETPLPKMEGPMKKSKLPKTDSIQKLAESWDTHDLTDFEDELEEVADPVFVRGSAITVHLESNEAEAIEKLAQAKGVSREELIRGWVLQKLARRNSSRRTGR
jgi:predicted DNA binding CopG/RHH family protein